MTVEKSFAMNSLLLISALIFGVAADESGPGWYKYDFNGDLSIPVDLGTPPQRVTFSFDALAGPFSNHHLEVYEGLFKSKLSKTFKTVKRIPLGVHGTDTVKIFGADFKDIGINVVENQRRIGYFSLQRGQPGNQSFIEQTLHQLGGDKTVILQIVDSNRNGKHKGSLVVGQRQPKGCSNDWKVYPARDFARDQFLISANSIEIGKHQNYDNFTLGFDSVSIDLEWKVYETAKVYLGVYSGKLISCGRRTPIVIKAGDLEWTIGPEEYLERNGGTCRFTIDSGLTNRLPLRFLKGHCLRYDYERYETSIAKFA